MGYFYFSDESDFKKLSAVPTTIIMSEKAATQMLPPAVEGVTVMTWPKDMDKIEPVPALILAGPKSWLALRNNRY